MALSDAEQVFGEVAKRLGVDAVRIPDGETGERRTPFPVRPGMLEAVRTTPGLVYRRSISLMGLDMKLFGLAASAQPDDIKINSMGFADAAKTSYDLFVRLRGEGRIPSGVRMQVSIPSPVMIGMCFVAPEEIPALLPAFIRLMTREMLEIADYIPHEDLAVQWDVAPEITEVLEAKDSQLAGTITREMIVSAIATATDSVPPDIQTGWHLCYGDSGVSTDEVETEHSVQPKDLGVVVDLANELCALIKRQVDWVHVPVPRDRNDDAYYAPLERLKLKPGMRLFLGLVHKYDGLDGAERRIAAARKFYPSFGVGTECGMGRRRPGDIPELLDLHHQIAAML